MYVEPCRAALRHCALRQLRHLRRHVTNDCFRSLQARLWKLRVCRASYLQRRLQSVLKAADRLVINFVAIRPRV